MSGVWWSVNWFYQLKCTNRTFTCIHGRYYIKLFRTGADSHNDILMSLLLVTEAKNWFILKLVSTIFYHIFISHQMIALKKFEKCFLFHLKSSFRSRDIRFFVFLSFPLFLPAGHCFGGWSKINLKVHDVINCLNKNLITHFVWYLEKEIRCDIETLPIDRELNKAHFYEKIIQKMCTKS